MAQKSKIIIFILLAIIIFWQKPIIAHLQSLLLVTQQFSQIPVKPLLLLTKEPRQKIVNFVNNDGEAVVADIFYPSAGSGQTPKRYPAVILAMGVKTAEKDQPLILGFGETLARLGFVVMWPRLVALDQGVSKMENPQTFISAFEYLEGLPQTDYERITFIGLSIGSSIALVAAENEQINNNINSLVFFGGYYDVNDYLAALNGQLSGWQPAEGAVSHLREISQSGPVDLEKINPAKNIADFKGKIFILHEKGDTYVPYGESVKLKEALERMGKRPAAFQLSSLFEHVQPKKGLSKEALSELLKLHLFVVKVFENL